VIWLRTSKLPLHDRKGKVIGVIGTYEDITERKRTEDALIQERHLLHSLMDNLPDRIYFKDRESRFTQINLSLANAFGLNHPSQAVGKTDFDFYSAEHAEMAYRDEQEIVTTGDPIVSKEEKETWPDGSVSWVSTSKMALRDSSGKIIHKCVEEMSFLHQCFFRLLPFGDITDDAVEGHKGTSFPPAFTTR